MKRYFILVLIMLFVFKETKAQEKFQKDSTTASSNDITVPASFPKGEKGWHRFLRWKMDDFTAESNYPQGDFELTVIISFKVDVDGSVIDVRVHKTSGNSKIDSYAIRVLESSPKWIPATVNGNKIKTKVLQGIKFTGRQF